MPRTSGHLASAVPRTSAAPGRRGGCSSRATRRAAYLQGAWWSGVKGRSQGVQGVLRGVVQRAEQRTRP